MRQKEKAKVTEAPRPARILVVEDEPNMVAGLRDNFEFEGYEVITAGDGIEGLRRALEESPDLVVLDVMMPRMSGLEVCKQLRAQRDSIPIIMLTARGQELDKVVGLELGADDYVTKPFSIRELLARVKAIGCRIISSATTPAEAAALERQGVDAVIAQGTEAGGHRGMFLTDDLAAQVGTFALVPQIADAVKVPVIATGGIGDARGIVAAFALGASGVQIGTAYLRCPESKVTAPARTSLAQARDDTTVITNVMTGRPARGVANRVMREVGPISPDAPAFPHAATAIGPLKAASEKLGKVDFTSLWAGQAVRLGREMPAADLTRALAGAALARLSALGA